MRRNCQALNACKLGQLVYTEIYVFDRTGFLREGIIS